MKYCRFTGGRNVLLLRRELNAFSKAWKLTYKKIFQSEFLEAPRPESRSKIPERYFQN